MKVRALLFLGPGRGEMLMKTMTLPDTGFPTDAKACAARSVAAVKHMWPSEIHGICLKVRVQRERFIAEGMSWQVEWLTDKCDDERTEFLSRLYEGRASNDELFAWAAQYETEMECAV